MAKNRVGKMKEVPVTNPVPMMPGKNGGMLRRGGTNPGAGAPPSAIRDLFKGDLLATREKLVEFMDNDDVCDECGRGEIKHADLIRLADFFAKYGIGAAKGGVDPALIAELAQAVREELPEGADMDGVLERILERWAVPLGRYAAGE